MASKKRLQIFKIKDKSDDFIIKHDYLWDCPHRLVICGRSGLSGKTTIIDNLLGQEDMYKNIFKPENVYIISPTSGQEKIQLIVDYLDIPESNVRDSYSDAMLRSLYERLKGEFEQEKADGDVEQKLIILDDVAMSGELSSQKSQRNSIINELLCASRHYCISVWILCQKYSQVSTTVRQNSSGYIFFETTQPELKQLADDHDITTSRRKFYNEFRKATKAPRSFFMINYHKPENRFYSGLNDPIIFEEDEIKVAQNKPKG